MKLPRDLVSEVVDQHRRMISDVVVTNYLGHTFCQYPGVFSPFIAPSGALGLAFATSKTLLGGARVLEIGCGGGILACLMRLNGAAEVLGIDTNPMAIDNARENAALCQVQNAVRFVEGDLFGSVADDEFDIIYADLPFMRGSPRDSLEAAFFEPELRSIYGYLSGVGERLRRWPRCRAYMCFSNLEDDDVDSKAKAYGLRGKDLLVINRDWIALRVIELSIANQGAQKVPHKIIETCRN